MKGKNQLVKKINHSLTFFLSSFFTARFSLVISSLISNVVSPFFHFSINFLIFLSLGILVFWDFLIFSFIFFIFFYLNISSIYSKKFKSFFSIFQKSSESFEVNDLDKKDSYTLDLETKILQLKKLLTIKDNLKTQKITFSNVIFRHPSILNNLFVISSGKKEGIKKDQLVFSDKGLVGKVLKSYDDYSDIITTSNLNFIIIVEIGDKRFKGIMKGNGVNSFINYVDENSEILVGDKVFINQESTIRLLSQPIGEVTKINQESGFLKLEMKVYSFQSKFNFVGVLIE